MNPKGYPQNLVRTGRPKGALGKATRDIQECARRLLEDPKYQASLAHRLMTGEAPHMETLLHHYAYGKPKDTLEVDGDHTVRVTFGGRYKPSGDAP